MSRSFILLFALLLALPSAFAIAPNINTITQGVTYTDTNLTNISIAFSFIDDDALTLPCFLNTTFGFSYFNTSVLNATTTLTDTAFAPIGTHQYSVNCTDGVESTLAYGGFEMKQRIVLNESIIPLVCPSDDLPNAMLFVFIGFLVIGMFIVNELFIKIPILDVIIGMGAMFYAFTLMGCSYVQGVIFVVFGIFMAGYGLIRGFSGR